MNTAGALSVFQHYLLLILLIAGVGVVGGRDASILLPQAIAGLVLAAAFIAEAGYLCCNAGNVAAVGLNFALAAAMSALLGGLVPLVMLPAPLAALAPYVPFTWIWDGLAGVYGVPANPRSVLFLLAGCCALFIVCLWRGARIGRRHAQ